VRHDIARLVGPDGTTTSTDLRTRVDDATVGRWVRQGRLIRPCPGVLLLPERQDDWRTRARSLRSRPPGGVSHRTALGWVVLRFSHRRLTGDPDGCRREIATVCAARRQLQAEWCAGDRTGRPPVPGSRRSLLAH
jgi:hypothetical protein